MTTIYKYPIRPDMESIEITMPQGAKTLSFGFDGNGVPCVWVLVTVNEGLPPINKKYYCVGTGWPLNQIVGEDEVVVFVGTIVDDVTGLVWHLFEGGSYD